MESLDKIRSYINKMTIRKAIIGGYDREDVYIKMNGLVDVFRDYVKDELEDKELQRRKIEMQFQQQKEEIVEYKQKLQESESTIAQLQQKLDEFAKVQVETEHEMEEMKDTYKKYCSNILDQYSGSLRTLSTEFSKILENISMLQQNIIELDSIETLEIPVDSIEEKTTFELPDLGIDIDEWLRDDEEAESK